MGSRSGDYALADPETRATLFSEAFTASLEVRAEADDDGRTVRFYLFGATMEDVVRELAEAAGEQQQVVTGSVGSLRTPVYIRPDRGCPTSGATAAAGKAGGSRRTSPAHRPRRATVGR